MTKQEFINIIKCRYKNSIYSIGLTCVYVNQKLKGHQFSAQSQWYIAVNRKRVSLIDKYFQTKNNMIYGESLSYKTRKSLWIRKYVKTKFAKNQ